MKTLARNAISVIVLVGAATAQPAPSVSVETGMLEGAVSGGVESFKGIPYAAAPVSDLRWKAPQPAAAWAGVRQALQFGNDCAQSPTPGDTAPSTVAMSENYLFLDVWRPAGAEKLPVMVWIHGGGLVNGGASPATYDGTAFAKKGVILVSLNYRLGRFGFFGIPALTAEGGPSGNYGLIDQIAALKWVKANIAAFGGDPGNVTIFGESAGGWSVHALLTSPMAGGLFHKAIIESGDGPALDGQYIVQTPDEAYRAGKFNKVSVMIGANSADLGFSMAATVAEALAAFGDDKDKARAVYDPEGKGSLKDIRAAVGMDKSMIEPARLTAQLIARQGLPAYEYRFSYVAPAAAAAFETSPFAQFMAKGAQHASELPFVFATVGAVQKDSVASDPTTADAMNSYWVNFAKTGDPSGPGLPDWPAYDAGADTLLNFTQDGPRSMVDPWRLRLDPTAAHQD